MAGRYLLIEFDDEAAASLLRAQIDAASRKGKRFRVIGLFARPGTPCSCPYVKGDRAKDRFKLGGKLGWWLCTTCRKPRLGDHQLKNLVPLTEIVNPNVVEGVDALHPAFEDREYIRAVPTLSIITLPKRVAK